MTEYQSFIFQSRYARWLEEEGRRETWDETVDRYIAFFTKHLDDYGNGATKAQLKEVREAILQLEVMPSMRCLMTAGAALEKEHVAGYNCAYVAVDTPKVFDEIMYVLMCGTGVGFSVERDSVNKLPEVPEQLYETDTILTVADSRLGWATSYRELLSLLWAGKVPKWDLSRLRPEGARLKTFGGRASGPRPLEELFRFTVQLFRGALGRKLHSIECHDLVCKIAEIVVVGGVRRSALISLSNLTDDWMRRAKSGQWWNEFGHRALANNSAVYTESPDPGIFLKEWLSLYESKSGERGIFSRKASTTQAGLSGRRDTSYPFGTNPCSEIILRPRQFCNLSEVVVRNSDSLDDLRRKVRVAAIVGTWQSTLTSFRYLSKEWKRNCEEERLLGVSLTGIMDHPVLNGTSDDRENPTEKLEAWLQELKQQAIYTNATVAKQLGIEPSVAITCVKPSGTVSQLVDSASGIHARHAPFYIRTVRSDKKDPLSQFMVAQGFPVEDDRTNPATFVFSFPIRSPNGSVFRESRSAIEQLELWKIYQEHWCEHKPSITVTVKENEWMEVGAWVYRNFDTISGVSFLPHTDHIYAQAPYQDIAEEEYKAWLEKMPKGVDWSKLNDFERGDTTTSSKEMACTGTSCEI